MQAFLALVLAIGAAVAAGYSVHGHNVHPTAQSEGPVPLCPPDAPTCN
jgi:hypothetical protein